MPESTRLAIVQQALADIVERLAELPASTRVTELRDKASSYDRVVQNWDTRPPSEPVRAAMLKSVIELNVEVMEVGKTLL
jgi:hypothetical protein